MANQTYFCTLTAIGEAKDANAKALGTALKFTEMAVGDGNGALPVPDRNRTALVRQVRRAPINTLKADPLNPGQVIAEQIIPEDVGGWWIRELGLYDDAGDLVAIGNCPETYKPQLAEGSGRVQVVRMVLIMSSAATVQLKIDPAVVLATRKYVDDLNALHLAAADPHPQYLTEAEGAARIQAAVQALVNSSPATLDTLAELAAALGNDKDFAVTMTNALASKAPKASPVFSDSLRVNFPAGAGTPQVAFGQAGDDPYLEMQRWTGTGTNFYGGRVRLYRGNMAFELTSPEGPVGSQTFVQSMFLTTKGLGVGTSTPNSQLELRKDDRSSGPVLTIHNRSNIDVDPNDYTVGGVWGAGFRDVRNPSYIAGIDFYREAAASGLSSRGQIIFYTGEGNTLSDARALTQRARIDSNGNWIVGFTGWGSSHIISKGTDVTTTILDVSYSCTFFVGDGYGYNTSACTVRAMKNMTTGRSINAGGTINAGGNDYAEYYRKATTAGVIAKGQIVGIDVDGKITDKWAGAVSFLIKSTDPSYVGGDTWGSEDALGMKRPIEPVFEAPQYAGAPHPGEAPGDDASDEEREAYEAAMTAYKADQPAYADAVKGAQVNFETTTMPAYKKALAKFETALEQARQRVDRIAFCGQVPVNVYGAKPGQYVLPVQDGDDIGGQLVDDAAITFDQYRRVVGIVQNILPDGRANVRVKPV